MISTLRPEFVTTMPDDLDPGVIYVTMVYATALHLCACGCMEVVVTPIAPDGWTLTFDGQNVSLHPSIGNWRFECRSHYWLDDGNIRWAREQRTPTDDSTEVGHLWQRLTGWLTRQLQRLGRGD